MPTLQIVEFDFDTGETLGIVLSPAADPATEFTANSVAEVRSGLYRATFSDQALPVAVYRFEATADAEVVGRGLVNIDAAAGIFRETADAVATVDGAVVADAINEVGVSIAEFTDIALNQLRAAEIDLSQWDPETEPLVIYRGTDHLIATNNAFGFTQADGLWPDLTGCTVQMEVSIGGVKAVAGTGTIVTASGENQQVQIQVLKTALANTFMKNTAGTFVVVRIDADENRFPMAWGVVQLRDSRVPV